ncbi:Endonuclease/exonuclease/phosphatase [Apodospora peruviana]|uniref:DNA-(apurinic or apyrimidinic site) endonuclease 2 n=1 Tax=Apodospora peruviana TaxID=516989 RepID=A0AAE0IUB3_9PEZI|nr:Endonuclease/exonuclease/phosphatase [Apodospora peruviana]
MGLRITTWNVNGIRNPFSYQPWRENRTFQAMFDTLEADIVIMQETKIQRKDLQDDMVLVPGWDVYFSLPKYKKGYSGVAIYTRSSKCSPIRAEEGITGVLCPRNSATKYRDLPEGQRIGGYPKDGQISNALDEATIDSEGRCVILEFPAFVLIGVYTPATRDETRTEFREGFIDALDIRVRNLVAMGKQVVLCGDLNIVRSELDTAGLQERLRKEAMTLEDFLNTPPRRFLNQILFGGRVLGERDEEREEPVLWDICREFNPERRGMYTCWETKKNARPGNFGSRIDYVLCSSGIKGWFIDSNIQEGLLGSDHCPVYATLGDIVSKDGAQIHIADLMNPEDMFKDGQRQREWTTKDLLPMSAKLIPEFDRRQSIRDMFFKRTNSITQSSSAPSNANSQDGASPAEAIPSTANTDNLIRESSFSASQVFDAVPTAVSSSATPPRQNSVIPKRQAGPSASAARPQKKSKVSLSKENSAKAGSGSGGSGQRSLMGFFKPQTPIEETSLRKTANSPKNDPAPTKPYVTSSEVIDKGKPSPQEDDQIEGWPAESSKNSVDTPPSEKVFDPVQNKESWGKLLGKRILPKCEHGDECQVMVTKKAGINCGRSFYVCARPLGPSGDKEVGTEFRCRTFIWSSDWSGRQ